MDPHSLSKVAQTAALRSVLRSGASIKPPALPAVGLTWHGQNSTLVLKR